MAKITIDIEEIKKVLVDHLISKYGVAADANQSFFEVDTAEEKDVQDIEGVRFVALF